MKKELNWTKTITKLKELWNEKNRIKILMILGFCGITLICLPEFLPSSNDIETPQQTEAAYNTQDYATLLSSQLEQVLGKIEGVGEISVMVTLSQQEEYVYALDHSSNNQHHDQNTLQQAEESHVILEQDGQEEALVTTRKFPRVQGVVIVCRGGDNPVVVQKLTQAVAAVLNISSNHIAVSKLG